MTKNQKFKDIEQAKKLYAEADKLIKEADKLISKGFKSIQFCGHYECEPLTSPAEYKGLINVHLFSGILKLEKLLGLKTEPLIQYDGTVDNKVKVLCVNGLRFYQIADTVEKTTDFKFK